MSASSADRRHVRQVEQAMEARALAMDEERALRACCRDLGRACDVHAKLDAILHELTGSLDGGEADQRVLFPVVDVSRATKKAAS